MQSRQLCEGAGVFPRAFRLPCGLRVSRRRAVLPLEVLCKLFLREGPLPSAASGLCGGQMHATGVFLSIAHFHWEGRGHRPGSDQARKPSDGHLLVQCLESRDLFKGGWSACPLRSPFLGLEHRPADCDPRPNRGHSREVGVGSSFIARISLYSGCRMK